MCGVIGIANNRAEPSKVRQMSQSIAHRGPDAEGFWKNENVALGHRRLSIIDLSPLGNQPMASNDGKQILVFNGELYNFEEIRSELQGKGYTFRSTSDTEVIVNAFQEWSTDALGRFNGMFALAVYDGQKNRLVLARDHIGIKPLYFHVSEDRLLFSSEIRGFKAYDPNWPINKDWPIYFLSLGFVPFPYTTLRDVFVLPKGSYLSFDVSTHNYSVNCYHRLSFSKTITSEAEALKKIREITFNAVDRHMISDAPLGIFLSGGIDSSLLSLVADHLGHNDLRTVSVSFSESSFDESPYRDIVLQRMRPHHHQIYTVDESMFIEHLDDIFKAMDQPSWDGVNSYFVSKCAHEAGLKAVLSGTGGDELFGGYPSFNRIGLLNRLRHIPGFMLSAAKFLPKETFRRLVFLNTPTNYNEYLFLRGAFTPAIVATITGKTEGEVLQTLDGLALADYPVKRDQNVAAFLEANVYLGDQLLKDIDYMSMWHSLEVRVPFLDRELMELVYSISPSVKFNAKQPKYLLTKAFADLLPDEITFRKKQGFTFPFSIWLKNNMDYFKLMLQDTPITQPLVNQFVQGKLHWSRLWALIVWKKFENGQNI